MNAESSTSSEEQEQEKRAKLREKYLQFMAKSSGCPVDVEMLSKTNVSGTLTAVEPESQFFIVSNLKTPIGVVDNAVLRATDIVKIKFNADDLINKRN